MPANLPLSGARVPLATEADDVPADLLRFGSDVDHLLVLKAVSQADRDARYANVPAGTLVTCSALRLIWQKLTTPPTAAAWEVLAERLGIVTAGVATPSANTQIAAQAGWKRSGTTHINLLVTWNGSAALTAGSAGNLIGDPPIFTLGAAFRPAQDWILLSGYGSVQVTTADGIARLRDAHPTSSLAVGQSFRVSGSYPTA